MILILIWDLNEKNEKINIYFIIRKKTVEGRLLNDIDNFPELISTVIPNRDLSPPGSKYLISSKIWSAFNEVNSLSTP